MEHEANIEFKDDIENLAANESLRSKPSSIGDNERLFAVLYTSGSTGKPKGARILHKSALNRLKWQWTTFPYRSDDVCVFKVQNIPPFGYLLTTYLFEIGPLFMISQLVRTNKSRFISVIGVWDMGVGTPSKWARFGNFRKL